MKKIAFLFCLLFGIFVWAHPMPNSVIQLDVHPTQINCELQIPLNELQPAVNFDVSSNPQDFLKNHSKELENYILHHFKIKDKNGLFWNIKFLSERVEKAEQTATGMYQEFIVDLLLIPPPNGNIRDFTLYYDVVMHQVVTHKTILTIRQDWETGKTGEKPTEICTISVDTTTLKVSPLEVNLEKGNYWQGFKSMVNLGMKHISEGTDHLMFLLTLLLTAPLFAVNRKWFTERSIKKSLSKILKITLAFTIGHSITLVLATLGLIQFPVKPVEVIIALSILITAVHVIVPLFPNKESFVAGGFGLIHGLAFSTLLSSLNLSSWRLGLSLLGFNLGIEIMQIFIVLLAIPFLLYLSRYKLYFLLKDILAVFAIICSLFWISERLMAKETFFTKYLNLFADHSIYFIVFLAMISLLVFTIKPKKVA